MVYDLLRDVGEHDAYANLVLPGLLNSRHLDTRDAGLATELGYGTLRALGTLDLIIAACVDRELPDIEPGVLDLLRLGAYQVLRTRIPPHAAVGTTVDLARATRNGRAAGFINAVLRKVARRDWDGWVDELSNGRDPLYRLALITAHPQWIAAAFAAALATDDASMGPALDPADRQAQLTADFSELDAALTADDARPQTHLVAWPGQLTRDELVAQAGGEPGPYSPYAVRMHGGDPATVQAVRARHAAVQDEGSQLCAIALTAAPLDGADERWLDLCAGPGGKTALLAALGGQRGATVTANELHTHRAELVAKATVSWPVVIHIGDARTVSLAELGPGANPPAADRSPGSDGLDATGTGGTGGTGGTAGAGGTGGAGFDRVLLDAPCSGLGALRRRPEARWRRAPEDITELSVLQGQLLDAALRLVRPGGVIAYVTCSPHRTETVDVVHRALDRHPGELEILDARTAFAGVGDLGAGPFVQLWPHRHGTDAMFCALLRRT